MVFLRPVSALLVAGLLVVPTPVRATATLACDVEDRGFAFHLQAAVGHEALTLSGVRGELRLPGGAAPIELDGRDLLQTWMVDDDLRLRVHVFGEGDRPDVDLIVVTRRRTETDHAGRYRLTIGAGRAARRVGGRIGCVVG